VVIGNLSEKPRQRCRQIEVQVMKRCSTVIKIETGSFFFAKAQWNFIGAPMQQERQVLRRASQSASSSGNSSGLGAAA